MPRRETIADVRVGSVRKKSPAFFAGLFVLGIFVIVGAVFLGKSDSGQIDVNSAIQNSNQIRRDEGGSADGDVGSVPEVFRNKTNGGLVPAEGGNEPDAVPPPVEATTTIETANEATTTIDQIEVDSTTSTSASSTSE